MFSIRHVDSHAVTIARQLLLQITADAVEHLKLECIFADPLALGKLNRGIDHLRIMGGDAVIGAAPQQQLHHPHIVVIDIFLVGISDRSRLVVSAFTQPYAGGKVQKLARILHRSIQIRLKNNPDIIQSKLRSHSFENIESGLCYVRSFHIDADKVAAPGSIFHHLTCIAKGQFGIDFQTELRQLDRNIRIDPGLID